jgi:hypothetical protein
MIWTTLLSIILGFADYLVSFFPNTDSHITSIIAQGITLIQDSFNYLCYFLRLDTLSLLINMVILLEVAYIGVLGLWLILRQTKLISK